MHQKMLLWGPLQGQSGMFSASLWLIISNFFCFYEFIYEALHSRIMEIMSRFHTLIIPTISYPWLPQFPRCQRHLSKQVSMVASEIWTLTVVPADINVYVKNNFLLCWFVSVPPQWIWMKTCGKHLMSRHPCLFLLKRFPQNSTSWPSR